MADLFQILERTARESPNNGCLFYDEEHLHKPTSITYPELVQLAKSNAKRLLDEQVVAKGKVVLLHFNRHLDYVTWFWSALAAGAIPAISTPLAADPVARARHLNHLEKLLEHPKIITSETVANQLSEVAGLDVFRVENLAAKAGTNGHVNGHVNGVNGHVNGHVNGAAVTDSDLAFLMLTSGSTGNAKAVEERHSRVIAAVEGKTAELGTSSKDIFLNWIGFDHVACVTEMHLHAVLVGALDIHVSASTVLQDPLTWLKLIERHSVTHSFAPNFFVGALNSAMDKAELNYDISSLRTVVSGGEANVVSTGITFNNRMHSMGAPANTLVPAFGMTETCGGSIYHRKFPALEKAKNMQFCSVGKGTNAIQYRITDSDDEKALEHGAEGNLELYGKCIFPAYYNDEKNTKESFTKDGWFKTGDKGYLDASGAVVLSGRVKDSIIINGVKYFSHELESALEDANLDGLVPSYTASFSTQPETSDSEELIIVFLPTQSALENDATFANTLKYMNETAILYCSKKPLDIIPLPEKLLPKSALGKLSRPKLKKAYEEGQFKEFAESTKQRLAIHRAKLYSPPTTAMEKELVDLFADEFELEKGTVGINNSLLDVGIDSLALFRFKGHIQKRLNVDEISMTVFLMNPKLKDLALAIDELKNTPSVYNPVVTMQQGDAAATPIWFFHPGLGEVLVFLNLSKYFSDRKVYGLRAPGFNRNEERFETLEQMVDTYVAAIRKKQPHGPYVLLGYSYGGLTVYNAAKRLEALGETVQFCGVMNLPPYVKHHMQHMDWCDLFLTLLSFMGFITEKQAFEWNEAYGSLSKEEVVSKVMPHVDHKRLADLDLDADKLDWWAGVADSVQSLARVYDPSGSVENLDVFYAIPIYRVSPIGDKGPWFKNEISRWHEFSRTPVRFHDCPGTHHTMIDPENVFNFQKLLKAALKERGVV